MDRGRHPKVIRVWMAEKLRKAASRLGRRLGAGKPEPRNKT